MSGLGLNAGGIGGFRPVPEFAARPGMSKERQRPDSARGLDPENDPLGARVAFSEEAKDRANASETSEARSGDSDELTDEEKKEVEKLRQRDQEVRRHEQAHVAAGGPYVRGGANLEYTQGPDGRMYATGGEVSIDVSPERSPEATIQKAQVVRRAALAPAEPSPQDRAVAAAATRLETQARQELSKGQVKKMGQSEESAGDSRSISGPNATPDSPFEASAAPVTGPKSLDIKI